MQYYWTRILAEFPTMPEAIWVNVALNGIKTSNSDWYNNWSHEIQRGKKITKEEFLKFLSSHDNTEKSSNFNMAATQNNHRGKQPQNQINNTGVKKRLECGCNVSPGRRERTPDQCCTRYPMPEKERQKREASRKVREQTQS